jgi:predicted nuclease of predicted toxin-antitoxin system
VNAEQRLLLDEMLSGEIAVQLRAKGHDVVAVVEDPALIGSPDEELLVHATSNERILVTANVRDFAAISASWRSRGRSHAGLIYVVNRVFPSDRSFGEYRTPPDEI